MGEQSGVINPFFDAPYGKASVTITTGNTIIATTGGYYMGCAIIASATIGAIIVYDNSATASGTMLDVFAVSTGVSTRNDLRQVMVAKNGFSVNLTGAGAKATIFYAPKG